MRILRIIASTMLFVTAVLCVSADWVAPHTFSEQFREQPNAAPTRAFPLGTDDLGRDRFSRLLYAGRTSLLLAPATALIAMIVATAAGLIAGYGGHWIDSVISAAV